MIIILSEVGGLDWSPFGLNEWCKLLGLDRYIYVKLMEFDSITHEIIEPRRYIHLSSIESMVKYPKSNEARCGHIELFYKDVGSEITEPDLLAQYPDNSKHNIIDMDVLFEIENNTKYRNDPRVLSLVDRFGLEKIFMGKCKIVEIPDDVDWEIHQHSGCSEFIREKSRTWW